MATLELLYFPGCPHIDAARHRLSAACRAAGHPAGWSEYDTTHEATPADRRAFASPTVLVDGVPVGHGGRADQRACVVGGAPTVEQLVDALVRSEALPSDGVHRGE